MSDKRLVELWLEEYNKWVVVTLDELEVGNRFRMWEDSARTEPVVDASGQSEWIVSRAAWEHKPGVWMVEIEKLLEEL